MGGRIRTAGVSMVWAIIVLSLLLIFASLAVDFGRVQLAKTELRRAADAAARAGAADLGTPSLAQDDAYQIAFANTCLGDPVKIDKPSDVELGTWDSTKRTFTPASNGSLSSANAIR